MLRQLLKSAIILLALFSLPLPAMAMFSDAAGVNYVLNSNGENTRGAIIPDQRVNAAVPDSITLNFTEYELHVGESFQLIATVWPDSLSARVNLEWSSRNQSVAEVNSNGVVTAVGVGSSVVSVICGTVRATCEITVKENEILAQAVELIPKSAELEVGETFSLAATIYPENTTDKSLAWSSSDAAVASVDENGVVTAVAVGSCVITATCGEVAGTCAITVKNPVIPADCIVLTPDSAVIEVGDILEITATVYPENATESRLTWRSSDENVATVHEHGHRNATVTALNPGECTITAECYSPNGVIMGSASITVKIHEVLADSVVLNLDSAMMAIGEELTLIAAVYPDGVTQPLTWQSSNEEIATVDQDGAVKALAAGECDVTASCGISSSCHIRVYDPADVVITFDCNEARVVLNHDFVLTPSVSLPVKTGLAVVSSDSTVVKAKVDDGKVTLSGVGFGKATIGVSSLDGLAQPDTCEVVVSTVLGDVNNDGNLTIADLTGLIDYMLSDITRVDSYYFDANTDGVINVSDLTVIIDILLSGDESEFVIVPESISLNMEYAEIDLGGSVVLEAFVLPEDVTNSSTTWTSTDESVAKVNDGVVSAVGVGECSIVVMCKDQASMCRIEVHETMPESVVLDQDNVSLLPGASVTLTATVYPESTTNKEVKWTSTDRNVATVEDGKVTAVAVGDCYIIADCQGVRDTCAVTVQAVEPESVVLSEHSVSLLPGASVVLTATVYPENTTNNTVTWSSTNRNVATVVNGKVTAVAVGDCNIIADCQGKRDTCVVTVKAVEPESIVLSQSNVTMNPGSTITLTATVYPANATNNTVTWISSKTTVATVSNGVVKAVAAGECDIIAICQNVQARCHVTVKEENASETIFTVNGVTFSMVPVEGGTFLMGTPATQTGSGTNERPQHFVTVSDYKIGQTEVTQELWVAVMGSNPSAFPGDPQRPVDNVSWEMCQEFIDSLNRLTGMNFRFPTEAEWEFAAKGGNQSKGYIFAGSNTPAPVAWYSTNSGSKTQPVAQKEANELGLYDMSGNVCEWCSDWYVSYESYSSASSVPVVNPTGPATGSYKMLRGGSWFEVAKCCRSGYRNMQTVTIRREFIGMRLAM